MSGRLKEGSPVRVSSEITDKKEARSNQIVHRRLNRKLGRILGKEITKDLSWDLVPTVANSDTSWYSFKTKRFKHQMAITTTTDGLIIGADFPVIPAHYSMPPNPPVIPINFHLLDHYPTDREIKDAKFGEARFYFSPRFKNKRQLQELLSLR